MKIMHLRIIIPALFIFIAGCSEPETDAALLALDKKALAEKINYDKITFYKFAKIALRSSAVQDTNTKEYQKFARHSQKIISSLSPHKEGDISVTDAFFMYQDYRAVKKFVKETDEDDFPLLTEGYARTYGDQKNLRPLLSKADKIYVQNIEHAILSVIVLASRDLGEDFALYESAFTKPELMDDNEMKTLLEYIRGFLFFKHRLYYLSEDGFSRNIAWLDKNKDIPLPYTKAFFGWSGMDDQQTHIAFHSMNHLLRAFDRLSMAREIDEKRGLEDLESFLGDTRKLGLQNEIVWAIESYLYLKQENPEKAIAALRKLQGSPLCTNGEKETIALTLVYLKDRDGKAATSGIGDKVFITKIVSRYMLSLLAKIDWQKVMEENKVPHTRQIFGTINQVKEVSAAVSKYTEASVIDQGKKELKEKSSGLLKQATDLLK